MWHYFSLADRGLNFAGFGISTRRMHALKEAGYTATPVTCGWAGAIFEVSGAFGQEQHSQKPLKRQKSKSVTDGPTDRRMDGPTKRGVESRSTRL